MQRVAVEREFRVPVERAFAYLAHHENLGPLFGARITRVRDGDDSRDGAGSVRRLRIGLLPAFEETVTRVVPSELIEYRISGGTTPLRDHQGVMSFSDSGDGGSRLRYVIEFGAAVPGLDRVVGRVLERTIRRNLHVVDDNA